MFGFEKIDLTISFGWIYFLIASFLLALYTFYTYHYTLPPVSRLKRLLMIFLRSSALLLLLFIFFEPVLSLTKREILSPVNLFFFDNSRSISSGNQKEDTLVIREIFKQTADNNLTGNNELFLFGSSVKPVSPDSTGNLNFKESSTDFSSIFSNIRSTDKNISSVTIISDGIITQGTTPVYTAEKLGIPVYTVGIGDSTKQQDVELKNVYFNEIIYSGTPTSISAAVINNGFSGKTVTLSLFENNQLLERKDLILDRSGVNSIDLTYSPEGSGEKKLTLRLSESEGEASYQNNQKVFFINVLDNKINVLIIAGAPSPDLTFIKNSLSADENLGVNTLTENGKGNFLERDPYSKLDSADIIYLLGYPRADSSPDLFRRLIQKLDRKNTPFFFLLTGDIHLAGISELKDILPVTIQSIEDTYYEVQPDLQLSESRNPLIQNYSVSDWNKLPPVYQPFGIITPKAESNIISRVKVNGTPRNSPLIVTRNIGSRRSVAFIGKDIWRWKLQMSTKNQNIFDSFIINSARWLNSPDSDKKVRIKSTRKIYSPDEEVEFIAQVYDESFNPVNDAEVKLKITQKAEETELILSALGNGLYEGKISLDRTGDFIFTGSAFAGPELLGRDEGMFNIGDIDIEMLDTRMNYEFLNLLSTLTDGKYYSPDNFKELLAELNRINLLSSKEKITSSEFRLWSYEWVLVIVILLFSLEWLIRKRNGML